MSMLNFRVRVARWIAWNLLPKSVIFWAFVKALSDSRAEAKTKVQTRPAFIAGAAPREGSHD